MAFIPDLINSGVQKSCCDKDSNAISWLAERLLASQDGPYSIPVEFIRYLQFSDHFLCGFSLLWLRIVIHDVSEVVLRVA
jgi:hypothetical protein